MEAAQRKSSVVLKVVVGVLAGFFVLALMTAVAVYRWYNSPATQERVGAVRDFMHLMAKASQAPGAEELRKLGCDQAAVFTKEEAAAFMESLGKFAPAAERGTVDLPMIFCNVRVKTALSCKDLTLGYATSVADGPDQMIVLLQAQTFPQQVVCSGLYARDGTLVESLQ